MIPAPLEKVGLGLGGSVLVLAWLPVEVLVCASWSGRLGLGCRPSRLDLRVLYLVGAILDLVSGWSIVSICHLDWFLKHTRIKPIEQKLPFFFRTVALHGDF